MNPESWNKTRREIRSRLLNGENKQDLYEDYRKRIDSTYKLIRLLNGTPGAAFRKKYRFENYFLFLILGIITVMELIYTSYYSLPWNIFLLYTVSRFETSNYGWIWFKGALLFIIIPVVFYFNHMTEETGILHVVSLIALILISSSIAFRLEKKQDTEDHAFASSDNMVSVNTSDLS